MPNCSICGKPYEVSLRTWKEDKDNVWKCLHDDPSIGISKLEAARKSNREQTVMAMKMANEAQQQENAVNPEVTIESHDPSVRTPFGQAPIKVRQSIIESLKSKSPIKD